MFKSTGIFRQYNNWLLIEGDGEITRYYRELYKMYRYRVDQLQRPENPCHITIVSKYQDKPKSWELKEFDGIEVEFEYDNFPTDDGIYIWLPVICTKAQDVRDYYCFGKPFYPFHS
jgi:uncharacterized membrane protein